MSGRVTGDVVRRYLADRSVYAIVLVAPNGAKTLISTIEQNFGDRIISISDEILMGHCEIYFHEWPA